MTDQAAPDDSAPAVLRDPTPAAAAEAVAAALRVGRTCTLVGRCEIEGPGADLAGDRLVLVKPDGSIAVHGAAKTAPGFRGSGVDAGAVSATGGTVAIEPRGDDADWTLRIEAPHLVTTASVAAGPATDANPHAAARDRLLADPDRVEPGFEPLATERETAAGPIDLYGKDAEGRHVAVEIKARRAGPAAVGQLDRYVDALEADLHAAAQVRGILIAPSATDRTRRLLQQRGFAFRRSDLGE